MVTLPYFNWEEIRGLSIGGTAKPVTDPNEVQPRERAYAPEVSPNPAIRIGREKRSLPGPGHPRGRFPSRLSQRVWAHRPRYALMSPIASVRDLRVRPPRLCTGVVNQRQSLPGLGSTAAAANRSRRACSAGEKGAAL